MRDLGLETRVVQLAIRVMTLDSPTLHHPISRTTRP